MDRKLMLFIMMGALILCSLFHWEDLICIFLVMNVICTLLLKFPFIAEFDKSLSP